MHFWSLNFGLIAILVLTVISLTEIAYVADEVHYCHTKC